MFVEASTSITETVQDGEMAGLIRMHDWDGSPLGPPAAWPPALQTTVDLMLASQFPMFVAWGAERCLEYNDAYSSILGKKHPQALGMPFRLAWSEIWHEVGPIADLAFANQPSYFKDLPIQMERNGYPELTYFTFSYSGVHGAGGTIEGMFCVCQETTAAVLAEAQRVDELERMRQLFQQAPGFTAMLRGPQHTFEMANTSYLQLTGFRDLLGKSVRSALPELAGQGFYELLDRVYATGEPYVATGMPVKLQRKPDDPLEDVFVTFVYQPIIGRDGSVTGIFVEGSEVTEQYLAQRNLAHNIERLEEVERRQAFQLELADRIRDLAEPDEITAAASEILGSRLGVDRVIYAEVDDDAHTFVVAHQWMKDGVARVQEGIRGLDEFGPSMIADLRAGQTVAIADIRADARTAGHADAYFKLDVMANLGIPLVKSGRLVTVLNLHSSVPRVWTDTAIDLARETAERTWAALQSARARAELKAERDQGQHILKNMIEGFMLLDREGRVLQINAEALAIGQRQEHEVLGRAHLEVWPEAAGTELDELYRRVLRTGVAADAEYQHTFPNGEQVWLEVRCHPWLAGGLAVFIRDISERKRSEDEQKQTQAALRLADRRKDEFLAMLAHELRNPLAPISAGADLLRLTRVDESRVRQISELISRQVKHMTSLVDDLMDVSRVTRGLVTPNKAPLDARQIVAHAVEQVRPLIDSRGHQLAVHTPPESAFVLGDQKRLIQVITNLLNNAAKYTPHGGSIVLKMDATPAQVVIRVTDNGIGLGPDMVDQVFELFTQAERTSDRSQGGLGIGLALVKSLVELHDGTVTAASAGLGQGSEFTIRLPRVAMPPMPGEGELHGLLAAPAHALRVLVVDDNQDAAMVLSMFLQTAGHVVAVEHDARRALERARSEPPDVCLLDIGLPDIDGNELARRLRAQPGGAARLLVAVTGYGQEQDRKETAEAGFDHHFVKPVDGAGLLALLAGVKRP
jgi:PAS domain S-box-containing protein